jgi:hypothetical protein
MEKLRNRVIPINPLCLFSNIRRSAIWKVVEEKLHLPAIFVDRADREGGQCCLIGEEHQGSAGFAVPEAHPPEMHWVVLFGVVAIQRDCLVGDHPRRSVSGRRIDPMRVEVGFGAGDEERACLVQSVQPLKIDISAIHHVDGAGLRHQHIERVYIVQLSIRYVDETRNIAP